MAEIDKKLVSINWMGVRRLLLGVLNFAKWPATLIGAVYILATVPEHWRGIHADWDLLLKYLDVLAWPIVALCVLLHVRPGLPSLMGRLEELKVPGGNARFSKAQEQGDTQGEELKEIAPDASEPNTKALADFQITDDSTHAGLTSYEAATAYAQIYADIFGTQIEVLRRLLDYTDGVKREDFADILKKHEIRSEGKGFDSILPFMEYLLRNTLIRYEDETRTYQLTIAGYYFLVFLHKAELLEKPKDF
jgi:hypothetical protein